MIEPVDDDWRKRSRANDEELDSDAELPDDDGSEPLAECPQCGAEIFDDAEQCPRCGEWIVRGRSSITNKPGWFMVAGFVGVILVLILWIAWR